MIANDVLDALPLSYTGLFVFVSSMSIQSDELYMNWYRHQVSILGPRGYEPRALPLRHSGVVVCYKTMYIRAPPGPNRITLETRLVK